MQTLKAILTGNTFYENLGKMGLCLGFIFSCMAQQPVISGGISSGGGSFFYSNEEAKPILLDFLYIDPAFKDTQRGETIPLSKTALTVGFDVLKDWQQLDAYRLLNERLKIWEKSSPVLVRMIRLSVSQMPVYITPFQISMFPKLGEFKNSFKSLLQKDEGDEPVAGLKRDLMKEIVEKYPDAMTAMVIQYAAVLGAIISVPAFNESGLLTQAGSFLHEALRELHNIYETELDHKLIMNITSRIMLTNPKDDESLDNKDLFSGKLKDELEFGINISEGSKIFCDLIQQGLQTGKLKLYQNRIQKIYDEVCAPGNGSFDFITLQEKYTDLATKEALAKGEIIDPSDRVKYKMVGLKLLRDGITLPIKESIASPHIDKNIRELMASSLQVFSALGIVVGERAIINRASDYEAVARDGASKFVALEMKMLEEYVEANGRGFAENKRARMNSIITDARARWTKEVDDRNIIDSDSLVQKWKTQEEFK